MSSKRRRTCVEVDISGTTVKGKQRVGIREVKGKRAGKRGDEEEGRQVADTWNHLGKK